MIYNEMNDPDPNDDLVGTVLPAETTDLPKPIKPEQSWKKKAVNAFITARQKMADISSEYPNALGYAKTAADTLVNLKYYDTPWSVAKGVFAFLGDLSSDHFYDISSLCSSKDGWRYLTSKSRNNIGFLFRDVVENLPSKKVRLRNNTTAEGYEINGIQIYYTQGSSTAWWLYFNRNQISATKLLKMLVAEKFKIINTKFLFVKEISGSGGNQITVLPFDPQTRPSTNSARIKKMLVDFNSRGHNRSLFLYGQPGTGKSTVAYTVLAELGYRTIVFSASNAMVSFDLIRDLCEMFDIEAVIIDDFDQFSNTNKNLDVLDYFNREMKVLLGIANSLSSFHPAILRPGRFDEPVAIEAMDKEYVEELLGEDLCSRFYKQVREFPVAYLNELKKKSQFLDDEEQDAYVAELGIRVEASKARMKLIKDFNSLL